MSKTILSLASIMEEIRREEREKPSTISVQNMKINDATDSHILASCNICIDDGLLIQGVKLLQGKEEAFVSMPKYKTIEAGAEVWNSYANIKNTNTEKALNEAVKEAYVEAVRQYVLAKNITESIKVDQVTICNNGSVMAFAKALISDIEIKGIRVMKGELGYFVSLPQRKVLEQGKTVWKDIVSTTKPEILKVLSEKILDAFNMELQYGEKCRQFKEVANFIKNKLPDSGKDRYQIYEDLINGGLWGREQLENLQYDQKLSEEEKLLANEMIKKIEDSAPVVSFGEFAAAHNDVPIMLMGTEEWAYFLPKSCNEKYKDLINDKTLMVDISAARDIKINVGKTYVLNGVLYVDTKEDLKGRLVKNEERKAEPQALTETIKKPAPNKVL